MHCRPVNRMETRRATRNRVRLRRTAQEIGDLVHVGNPEPDQREDAQFGVEAPFFGRIAALGIEQGVEFLHEIGIEVQEGKRTGL